MPKIEFKSLQPIKLYDFIQRWYIVVTVYKTSHEVVCYFQSFGYIVFIFADLESVLAFCAH